MMKENERICCTHLTNGTTNGYSYLPKLMAVATCMDMLG